jgi:hypothetical protein
MARLALLPNRFLSWSALTAILVSVSIAPKSGMAASPDPFPTWRLQARIVAVGLPGAAGVRQVGRFHSGGPIPGNPEFLLSTGAGRVLDPARLLVASTSNFGAPSGNAAHATGSVLSIDPDGAPGGATLLVPASFAASSGQSEAAGGAIRLYTAQSEAFRNLRYNSRARTADHAAAAAPRYISINNAFGRPWIANAPNGLRGEGSVTVVDPDGAPLDNAPSREAGGVFAGSSTNRQWVPKAEASGWLAQVLNYRPSGQLTPGALEQGALGTAFLGPSPDGSGFAVFAAVTANGAVVQIHVQDGVDGLAEPGTIANDPGSEADPGVIGIAFKWNPDRVLYVADIARNRLMLLHLDDDRRHFTVARTSVMASPALNQPVDLAAAVPEIANPRFASHTTLAGGSDLYVANRGDGSLVRLRQDGQVLARADIEVPALGTLGKDRIRAIAVSADAQRLWITLQGELPGFTGYAGALIEVSAFDAEGPFQRPPVDRPVVTAELSQAGAMAFQQEFTPQTGLGPLFNATSCVACHPGPGGASAAEEHFVRRVARMDPLTGRVTPIDNPNSPVARRRSTLELGQRDAPPAALPRLANVASLRMPLALHVSGRLDEIPDAAIQAQAVSKGDGIKGRVHVVASLDGERRVGRYGWKAHAATLEEMVADAFANEIGISSALAPHVGAGPRPPVEDDGSVVRAVAAYLRTLRPHSGSVP